MASYVIIGAISLVMLGIVVLGLRAVGGLDGV